MHRPVKQVRPTIARARELRANLTKAEARMWGWLKTLRAEGFRFRRQAPYRGYYLDFVCLRLRLVIELDGPGHGEEAQQRHDLTRDAVLEREGFRVLRFANRSLDEGMPEVVSAICEALQEQRWALEPTSPPGAPRARLPSP